MLHYGIRIMIKTTHCSNLLFTRIGKSTFRRSSNHPFYRLVQMPANRTPPLTNNQPRRRASVSHARQCSAALVTLEPVAWKIDIA